VQSPDHPDLLFVQAKKYAKGRPDGSPLWIVVHDMEASETRLRAENTAHYFATLPDGRSVSSHYTADNDSVVQCVRLGDVAFTVGNRPGNYRGINWEFSGFAAQTREQWLDDFGKAMFAKAAPYIRADAAKYKIPLERRTVAELKARKPGVTSHNDLRLAFGNTTHTDPGPNYPWDYFMDLLNESDKTEGESMAIVFNWGGKTRMGFGPAQGYKTMADDAMYRQWRSAYSTPPCYPETGPDGYPTQTLEERGFTAEEVAQIYGTDMDEAPPPGVAEHSHDGTVTIGPARPLADD
jgi:hypothetical protein